MLSDMVSSFMQITGLVNQVASSLAKRGAKFL